MAFSFRSNFHKILSLSSVFLLQNATTNDNILGAFSRTDLQRSMTSIKTNDLAINVEQFRFVEFMPVIETVHQQISMTITKREANQQITNFALTLQGNEKSVVDLIARLSLCLPCEAVQEDNLKSFFFCLAFSSFYICLVKIYFIHIAFYIPLLQINIL